MRIFIPDVGLISSSAILNESGSANPVYQRNDDTIPMIGEHTFSPAARSGPVRVSGAAFGGRALIVVRKDSDERSL